MLLRLYLLVREMYGKGMAKVYDGTLKNENIKQLSVLAIFVLQIFLARTR